MLHISQRTTIKSYLDPILHCVIYCDSEASVKSLTQDKIEIKLGSWFEPLKNVEGQFVGLVSNPPYIPSHHIIGLQAEVAKHEPRLALDGGSNGMNDLLHLCHGAASMLKPGGFFAFEVSNFL